MLGAMRARICALIVLAAGCKPTVQSSELEADLSQRVTAMGLHATKVTCPGGVEARPGQAFTCQITLGAKTYALDVTITGVDKAKAKADFTTAWHDGPAVQTAKEEALLGGALTKDLGGAVALHCGDEPLAFLDSAYKLHCTLAARDVKTKATFGFDAKTLDATDWHLDPPLIAKAKIEAVLTPAVHEKLPDDVVIDCGPAPFMLRPADGVLTCKATRGAETAALEIEVDDNLNVKRWEIAKP